MGRMISGVEGSFCNENSHIHNVSTDERVYLSSGAALRLPPLMSNTIDITCLYYQYQPDTASLASYFHF